MFSITDARVENEYQLLYINLIIFTFPVLIAKNIKNIDLYFLGNCVFPSDNNKNNNDLENIFRDFKVF